MTGKLVLSAKGEGMMLECNLKEVSLLDKMLIIHNIMESLDMSETDMKLFSIARELGTLDACTSEKYSMDLSKLVEDPE